MVSAQLRKQDINNCTDSEDECLRPSLLKKRHQLSSHSKVPHHENTPWNGQSTTPDHKATRIPATAYDSPAHQTPFAALFSSCPSTGIETGSASSPAEHNLRGNPTPTSLLGAWSAIPGGNGHAGASEHHHAKSSHGISKVVTNISKLKKENAHFAQRLKEHEYKQQQLDLQLKDEAFLQRCLQQLTGTSDARPSPCASDMLASLHSDSRPAGGHDSVCAQPAQTDTRELWQQLSSESSSSNEGHQLEELQAQLHHSNQQLRSKEAEVVGLTVELLSLHTQLETTQTESAQRLEAAQAQAAESAQQAESALVRQLDSTRQQAEAVFAELEQSRVASEGVSMQLQKAEEALAQQAACQADLEAAATTNEQSWRDELSHHQQQVEALSCQLAQSQESNSQLSAQLAEARQQLEQASHAHLMDESTMLDQLSDAQAELQHLTGELAQAHAAQVELSEQAAKSTQQLEQLSHAHVLDESTMSEQLSDARSELQRVTGELAQAHSAQVEVSEQAAELGQQLEQLSHAHVLDESTMLDQLSEAQSELQCLTGELTQARAAQVEASEQAAELRQQLDELQEAQTLTEATLLDQLTDAQTELERSLVQVRHMEQRHQEMCQQLVLARVGQAEAMEASRVSKQRLQAAQSDHQNALAELARTHELLLSGQKEAQQQRLQLAACTRELSTSGMQRFELSQTLQEAQTELTAQLELSGKLQARAKKYRASHGSLCKQLEAAKAESAAHSRQREEALGAVEQQLAHTKEQLEGRIAELVQAAEGQQQQSQQAEADKQQALSQAEALGSQLIESSQQLTQSDESVQQLKEQLQVASCSLAESQKQCSQAGSDCLSLRCQLAETASQLEQSCSRQAEYAVEQQRAATELASARSQNERLACSRAQAQAICQTSDAQLKDLQRQHSKLRAQCEQVAVRSARHEALHADLLEAQAQLASQCARLQIEEQKAGTVCRRLAAAGRSLADALYNTRTALGQPVQAPGHAEESMDLSSAAEQVCCLVQALLLHYNQSCAPAKGRQESAAVAGGGVDVLRCHVAEAQARANHIVNEFESMLMVTGGHSMKEVMHIQSQAGLVSNSPPAAKNRKLAHAAVPARKQSCSATQTPKDRPSRSRSSLNGGRPSHAVSTATGVARQSVKSSAISKENKAPPLTYVLGGQVRGSRKPHDVLIRQPLRPSVTNNTKSTCTSR